MQQQQQRQQRSQVFMGSSHHRLLYALVALAPHSDNSRHEVPCLWYSAQQTQQRSQRCHNHLKRRAVPARTAHLISPRYARLLLTLLSAVLMVFYYLPLPYDGPSGDCHCCPLLVLIYVHDLYSLQGKACKCPDPAFHIRGTSTSETGLSL